MPPKVRDYLAGDLVFAKIKGYPPWPARVEGHLPPGYRPFPGRYPVFFFGTYETAVVSAKDLYPYEQYKHKLGIRRKMKNFNEALHEIATRPDLTMEDGTVMRTREEISDDNESSSHTSDGDKIEEEVNSDANEPSSGKGKITAIAAEDNEDDDNEDDDNENDDNEDDDNEDDDNENDDNEEDDNELEDEEELDETNVRLLKKKTFELEKSDSDVERFDTENGAKQRSKRITTYKAVKSYSDDSSGDNYVVTTPESEDSFDKERKALSLPPAEGPKQQGHKSKTPRPIPAPEDDSDGPEDGTRKGRKRGKRDTSVDSDSELRKSSKKQKKSKKGSAKKAKRKGSSDTSGSGEKNENLEEKLRLKAEKLAAKLAEKEREKERRKREKMEKKRLERLKRAQSKESKDATSEMKDVEVKKEEEEGEKILEKKNMEDVSETINTGKSIGKRLAEIDHAIKNSLSKTGANVDRCLDAMDSISALNITTAHLATFGIQLKELIGTLRKCRKYKQDVRVCIKADENLSRLKQFATTNEEPRRESTEVKDEQQVKDEVTLENHQDLDISENIKDKLDESVDEDQSSAPLSSLIENSEENISEEPKSETSSHECEPCA